MFSAGKDRSTKKYLRKLTNVKPGSTAKGFNHVSRERKELQVGLEKPLKRS